MIEENKRIRDLHLYRMTRTEYFLARNMTTRASGGGAGGKRQGGTAGILVRDQPLDLARIEICRAVSPTLSAK